MNRITIRPRGPSRLWRKRKRHAPNLNRPNRVDRRGRLERHRQLQTLHALAKPRYLRPIRLQRRLADRDNRRGFEIDVVGEELGDCCEVGGCCLGY
jgi:hypothetical protein